MVAGITVEHIRDLLSKVLDPEVPALSIVDLGILRDVSLENSVFEISITPTFTGCPAMKVIEEDIVEILHHEGINNFKIKTVLAPAWTTDWMSPEGKKKLKEYGIAPPSQSTEEHLKAMLSGRKKSVQCPFCNSLNTKLTSAFGSTACKALHFCNECHQPFEEFKCH
ncbi:MAG: phenylacetate-CoA oxygenase subunit PaaJ [Bacteroidetes bacterium]|nr:phenylacetate-CoA oxygenase subunit PaaJ [Bacteroidota bacterium]